MGQQSNAPRLPTTKPTIIRPAGTFFPKKAWRAGVPPNKKVSPHFHAFSLSYALKFPVSRLLAFLQDFPLSRQFLQAVSIIPAATAHGAAEAFSFILRVRYGDQGAALFAAEFEDRSGRDVLVGVFPVGLLAFLAAEAHAEILVVPHLDQCAAFAAMEFADHRIFLGGFLRLHFFRMTIRIAFASAAAILLPRTSLLEFFTTYHTFHDLYPLARRDAFLAPHSGNLRYLLCWHYHIIPAGWG